MPSRRPTPPTFNFRFPVFALLSVGDDAAPRLAAAETEVGDCVLMYRHRELAELYVEQARSADPPANLDVLAVEGDDELRQLLTGLPPGVAHVLWDAPTSSPRAAVVVPVRDLLELVE